ncbi:Vta1 like-domain-containing protein [Dimargaris cristalligena]|uniref:Vta1 like-domain-containing protein n=1 Tax=Dimargaris cristalligena TaxID=215637 RepID=A0A4Q0A2I3_9FUNG|nr:Vta1 like-domain-containing protein [Dimargaris cristalligena]|eukprot:RKP40325.1 Vta1 like-domain-containing protein [Dimargaris cristalligena]
MDSLPAVPEQLRFINQFLQRSRELRTHEPIISYYCQFYAVKLALAKGIQADDCQVFLLQLVEDLEARKEALSQEPAIQNDEAGKAYLELFATRIFTGADNEDRAGKASKQTGLKFLASSVFIELLRVFGDLSPEFEEKLKYAKWKAKDIIQALKEGRMPVAGPAVPEATMASPPLPPLESTSAPLASPGFVAPVTYPNLDNQATDPSDSSFAHSAPAPFSLPPTNPAPTIDMDYDDLDDEVVGSDVIAAAEKHTRFVLSALQFDDVKSAMENLQKAMEILQPYHRP